MSSEFIEAKEETVVVKMFVMVVAGLVMVGMVVILMTLVTAVIQEGW